MELESLVEVVKINQVINPHAQYYQYKILSPDDAAHVLQKEIGQEDREVFMVLVLNTKNQITALHRCHVGSINASIVHPREVVRP